MSSETYGQMMLRFLAQRAAQGATAAEIKAYTRGTMQCYIQRYAAAGIIGFHDEPAKRVRGAQILRRYWLREHCPPAATLQPKRELRKIVRKVPADIPSAPNYATVKPRPPIAASDDFKAAAPRITERTKVTIWTPQPDPRAAKIPPAPPLFGKLSTGRAPEPRPWAAAVAGGAR